MWNGNWPLVYRYLSSKAINPNSLNNGLFFHCFKRGNKTFLNIPHVPRLLYCCKSGLTINKPILIVSKQLKKIQFLPINFIMLSRSSYIIVYKQTFMNSYSNPKCSIILNYFNIHKTTRCAFFIDKVKVPVPRLARIKSVQTCQTYTHMQTCLRFI